MVTRKKDESEALVALSPVLDYEMRPLELEKMPLYDWIRLTEKQKVPKQRKKAEKIHLTDDESDEDQVERNSPPATRKLRAGISQKTLLGDGDYDGYSSDDTVIADDEDDEDYADNDNDATDDEELLQYRISTASRVQKKSSALQFAKEHPQYKTHCIRLLPEEKEKIPNFVGGILPRHDKGDHEEYCRTMLTLFKPWTDPMSLKLPDQTWENAFAKFDFSDKQKQIMGFFHVRYECNDARDDFRAQRVNEAKDNGLHWIWWSNWCFIQTPES